jgi:hypothetical protein
MALPAVAATMRVQDDNREMESQSASHDHAFGVPARTPCEREATPPLEGDGRPRPSPRA